MHNTLTMSLILYGAAMLPRLRAMSHERRRRLLIQADRVGETVPLHLHRAATLHVPLWSPEPLTGAKLLALLVFGLWVQCSEREETAGPLLEAWPIREALLLCDGTGEKVVAPGDEEPSPVDGTDTPPLLALLEAARGVATPRPTTT